MKRLILLSVLLLVGCFQGATGPAGDQSFLVSGTFADTTISEIDTSAGTPDTLFYTEYVAITVTPQMAAIRDRDYGPGGYYSCPDSIWAYNPTDKRIEKTFSNAEYRTGLQSFDTLESDGWHLQSAKIEVGAYFSPLPTNCTYTLIVQ